MGRVYILKIENKCLRKVHCLERKIENSSISYAVTKILCNPIYKNFINVTYDDLMVDLYTLSQDLCEGPNDEVYKINKIINNYIN
jgi:hypothetical protein